MRDTVLHAMAGQDSEGKWQTEAEAKAAVDSFIANPQNALEQRIHAAQDRAAPWHNGQRWDPAGTSALDQISHLLQDMNHGPQVESAAAAATAELLGIAPPGGC